MTRVMSKRDELADFGQYLASTQHPHLISHQSSSLPTTPDLRARKPSFGARSPSLEKSGSNGSPKSSHSDTQKSLRSRSKAPSIAGCKYETGMTFSRRRIPYSIGGDQLERPKTMPKKYLDPVEEGKLSGDMRELYDRILPSAESNWRRAMFVLKLEHVLNQQWAGSDIKVHVFGSSGNLLCTSESDVDICITTPLKALERVCLLANALAEHGMEKVVCVPHAKVPIVKFWDPALRLACDMNVNNTLALENTRMIKTYVKIDERVRPLAMIIKQWTKRRILNDAALGGTLSSYTWICLILNFLQTRNPPILPSLHKKPHLRRLGADGKPLSFDDDLERLRGFGNANKETLGELLFHFFRRYAYDLDYEKNVISVRDGKLISKEGKKWHFMQNNRLCVEEPFNTERNLGNTADDISFRGIHIELRRAFDFIKDANLNECFEEYTFPATEEKIWERPPSKPPPVLTRSRSQSQSSQSSRGNRGGYSNRGGSRHGLHNQRSSGRRASSAAALNKMSFPTNGLHGLPARDRLSREQHNQAQFEQLQLHNELYSKYQILQAQEHELRLLQAQTQLHAQIQTQGSSNGSSAPPHQPPPRGQHHRVPVNPQVSLTDPLRNGQFFHPFQYPQVPGTPQQSIHTQPSSPSLKTVQPDLRRSVHRSSFADNTSANHRSHSQPARPLPPSLVAHNIPPIPLNNHNFLQYQHQLRQHRQQQPYSGPMDIRQGHSRPVEVPVFQDPRHKSIDQSFEDSVPKEYVGYWVDDSPPHQGFREDHIFQRLPTYYDLHPRDHHPRVRGVPYNLSRLKDASRSPSPSTNVQFRDRSFSVRSASSAPPLSSHSRNEQNQPVIAATGITGPFFVTRTDGWTMPSYSMVAEPPLHNTDIRDATSGLDEEQDLHASTDIAEMPAIRGVEDDFTLSEPRQHLPVQPLENSRMPLENRNGNVESLKRSTRSHPRDTIISPDITPQSERSSKSPGGLGIQFGEHEIRRPSIKVDGKVSPQIPRSAITVQGTEVKSEQKPLVPVPLLSPVREIRTPSPTAKRRETAPAQVQRANRRTNLDLYIPPFAELMRAKQEKQTLMSAPNGEGYGSKDLVRSKASGSLPPISTNELAQGSRSIYLQDDSPKGTVQQSQINGWQQQSGRKSKKNRSRPGSGQFSGERVPLNEAERKGG